MCHVSLFCWDLGLGRGGGGDRSGGGGGAAVLGLALTRTLKEWSSTRAGASIALDPES